MAERRAADSHLHRRLQEHERLPHEEGTTKRVPSFSLDTWVNMITWLVGLLVFLTIHTGRVINEHNAVLNLSVEFSLIIFKAAESPN